MPAPAKASTGEGACGEAMLRKSLPWPTSAQSKVFLISVFDLAMLVVNARAALMAIVTASVSMFDEMNLLDRRKTIEQVIQQGRSHVPSN